MVCRFLSVISIIVRRVVAEVRLQFEKCCRTEEKRRNVGVLWSGDHLFEGTVETIEMLKKEGASSQRLQSTIFTDP